MRRFRIVRFIYIPAVAAVAAVAFLIVYFITMSSGPTVVMFNKKLQAATPFDQLRVMASRVDDNEKKMDKRMQDNKYKGIVKTRNSSVYMYSAIQTFLNDLGPKKIETEEPTKAPMSMIVVSGWELDQNQSSNLICCHMMENGNVQITSSEKRNWLYLGMAKLQAKQYTCHISNNSLTPQLISIEPSGSMCPIDKQYYKPVETVVSNSKIQQNNSNKTIALCSKVAFGSLDARRLIEWFEVHRLFGVDKVFSYLNNLNSAAKRVFEYYEHLGMAETREFNLPDTESFKREVGSEDFLYYNDEQVVLYDCQERTRNYNYVAIVDTDEFMVPSTNVLKNAWKTFMNNMFQEPYLAGFFVLVRVHVTTWGPSMPNHSLFIGQYNNCTLPWYDRMKIIHMPSRVQPGSVSTHHFEPLPGYKQEFVDGEKASLHHFRWCREEWLKPGNITKENNWLYNSQNETECYDFRRLPSDIMQRVADAVQESVIRVINEIGV